MLARTSKRDADHVVRLDRDWTSFLEVVRDEAQPTDHDWAAQITSTAAKLFTTSSGLCMTIVEHAPDLSSARSATLIAEPRMRELFNMSDAGIRYLGVEKFREYYYPRHIATTHQEIERAFDRDYREQAAAMRRGAGFSDALGLILHPDPGIVIVLFALHERPIVLDRNARALLTRLGLHIETAYRLRRRGSEIVKAILDRDGKVLFTAPGMPSRDALSTSAQTSIRQLRDARDHKSSLSAPDAIALWPALIAGHLSLVERRIDGQPRYLLGSTRLRHGGVLVGADGGGRLLERRRWGDALRAEQRGMPVQREHLWPLVGRAPRRELRRRLVLREDALRLLLRSRQQR